MRHFLEVDDLRPGRALDRARPGRAARPAAGAGRPGRGPHLREALQPDPQRHRDGGGRPGRPPGNHPGRGDRPRRAGAGRRRHPGAGPVPPRSSEPGCSITACSKPWRRSTRCRSSTCCPTGPIPARRWPTCSPCDSAGAARRATPWPGSATATTWPAASPSPAPWPGWTSAWPARRATSSTRWPSTGPGPGGVAGPRHDRPGRGGRRAPTPSTPTSGCRWARRPSRPRARTPSPAIRSTRP